MINALVLDGHIPNFRLKTSNKRCNQHIVKYGILITPSSWSLSRLTFYL